MLDREDHHFMKHPSCPACSQVFRDHTFGKNEFRAAHEHLATHQWREQHCVCEHHQMGFRTMEAYEEHCAAHNAPGYGDPHYLPSITAMKAPGIFQEGMERASCPSCTKVFLGEWEQHGSFPAAGAKDPMESAVLVRSAQAALEAHQEETAHC